MKPKRVWICQGNETRFDPVCKPEECGMYTDGECGLIVGSKCDAVEYVPKKRGKR